MNLFEYTAVNEQGKKISGRINARSSEGAVQQLQSKSLYPIDIKSVGTATEQSLFNFLKVPIKFNKFIQTVPIAELTEFTRQFGTLIETGIPYHRALDIIIPSEPKTKLEGILSAIKLKVLEGSSLYKAVSEYPSIFPKQYTASILAGEKTGKLGENMLQQAKFLESQMNLKNKVQAAMIYPAIMMVLGIGILIFMVEFILPKIVPIFSFFDHALPLPTRILIFVSDFFSNNRILLIVLLLLILFGLKYFLQKPYGQIFKDKMLLKLPVIGPLQNQILILKFSLSLGTLLHSGITVKEALPIAGESTGSIIFNNEIKNVLNLTVTKGYTLSAALKVCQFFENKYIQIIKVGEESGKLESIINKLADNLQSETQAKIQKFVALLEPMIILFMAGMVGTIVLAILLPIFELNLLIQ